MRFGSVCSGIEAASVAWKPLGWECAFVSEIEPFPCALLAHYYPDTPNLGDMTKITEADLERCGAIDVLVGGTPCQSFSVAGLRQGLRDPRGNLALEFLRILERTRARWVLWENVPGVLSSGEGRDFGSFLGGLGQLGYGFAYRVLDAQYFGLAQRRKRVFVVGHLGDWRRAAAVLLEPESLSGNPPPRRAPREGVAGATAPSLTGSGRGVERAGESRGQDPLVVANALTTRLESMGPGEVDGNHFVPTKWPADVAPTLSCSYADKWGLEDQNALGGGGLFVPDVAPTVTSKWAKGSGGPAGSEEGNLVAHSPRAEGYDAGEDGTGRGAPLVTAFDWQSGGDSRGLDPKDTAQLQRCQVPAVAGDMAVRRLTPRECERLQGFPDDYTLVPYRGKPASDGPRYRALGNSMAVPVMAWLGRRIALVETLCALPLGGKE